jgi:hypothetical protein
MNDLTQVGLIVVLVAGICQAIKFAGLQSRFVPLLSVVLGIAGAFVFDGVNFLSTGAGVILGLSTSGLYDVVKTSILNK